MDSVFVTIDRGNTRTKAALWTPQGSMCAYESFEDAPSPREVAEALVAGRDCRITTGALCTVVNDSDFVRAMADMTPTIAVDCRHCRPLVVGYDTPATLGADRIAAAAGALAIAGGCDILVADIGTAATFDFVDAGGIFRGGNISAGIAMRLAALHDHTSALPLVGAAGPLPTMGTDTATALRSGAVRGLVAELEYYRRLTGARVIVTGGDAPAVLAAADNSNDYIHDPYLVMRGLFNILKHND